MNLLKRWTYRFLSYLLITAVVFTFAQKVEAASSDGFTITASVLVAAPTVTSLSALTGSVLSAANITITGTGFFGSMFSSTVSAVNLDDGANTALTGVTVVSDSEIRATVPAGVVPGVYNVLVTAEGGTNLTSAVTFTVQAGYTNSITVNVLRVNSYDLIIKPVTNNIEVAIPVNSFKEDVSFTFATKANLPAADRAAVKLSAIGVTMTAIPHLQPVKNLTVTIRYRDQDILGLDEDKLAIAKYDTASKRWLVLRSTVYKDENKVTALVSHLSTYAIIQNVPAADLSGIRVYPNPWDTAAVPQGVVIDGLTATAELKIYTITGELVVVLNETNSDGRVIWNGQNSGGGSVASGIYIAVVKNGVEMKRIKIGVER
ncbi:MAG: hypothetical protein A2231_11160 [Candidatus Firestonebacteria bacterium RIFOXYA2_FULL_40_8]|nr:MAG: hypothetical protein A2231_11160 [Candidatus Firestonebacteria bacterium RIFOXYA2_FULL_40_8]